MRRFADAVAVFLPYLFLLGVLFVRLSVSHPHNFVPVFTCVLFFAAIRPSKELPILLLMLIGADAFLTTHRYGMALTADHAITWAWYFAAAMLGVRISRHPISVARGVVASVLVSLSFFVASNFAVWAGWDMYPMTWGGLGACYVAALPFFRNSLVAETLFSALAFGICNYALLQRPLERIPAARC